MEKLQRLIGDGPVTAPVHNALLDVIDGLREHVDHLYGCLTDIAEWAEGVDGVPRLTFRQYECPRMTADEAAAVILAEQAKLTRALNDPKLRVWTRGVVALLVGALREHGREDR